MELDAKSRIVVVGTSGSGKSTLARQLSALLGVKDVELDALFWGPNWTQTSQAEFRTKIESATSGTQGWVVHGNYGKVRDITWGRATVIIWLDYSRAVVFWRVFKRSVLRILTRAPLWSGNRETFAKTFLSRDSIILWSIQTYSLRREQYRHLCEESTHLPILRFENPRALENFMKFTFNGPGNPGNRSR